MSDATEVKRHASMGQGDCSVEEYPNGEYVLFTDYDLLATQLRETQERLRGAREALRVLRGGTSIDAAVKIAGEAIAAIGDVAGEGK
jgi:hypothetical protein